MIEQSQPLELRIKSLMEGQNVAVLASQNNGQPYTSLMAYAFTKDLKNIVVAMTIATRKHQNIIAEPRVALLVDDRSNSQEDFQSGAALTIIGKVTDVHPHEKEHLQNLYLERHSSLKSFITTPSTTLVKIAVEKYLFVSKFEDVAEYSMNDGDQEAIKHV